MIGYGKNICNKDLYIINDSKKFNQSNYVRTHLLSVRSQLRISMFVVHVHV